MKPPEQIELFADHRFFLVLSSLVSGGTLKKIKPLGLTVLVVMRCFADHKTGVARVSHGVISKFAGISRHSVMRAIATLEEEGLIVKQKEEGRQGNAYRIVDKVPVFDGEDKPVGEVSVPYVPQKTGNVLHELKNFLSSGFMSQEAKKYGMTFNLNITINNNQQTTNINAETVHLTLSQNNGTDKRLPTADEERSIQFVRGLPPGSSRDAALAMLRLGGLTIDDE
jgi:hypothetical protein